MDDLLNVHRTPLNSVTIPHFTEKETADQRGYVLAEGHTIWTFRLLFLKTFSIVPSFMKHKLIKWYIWVLSEDQSGR